MAIKRPDEYVHNNPALAIADSDNVRGGRRTVADREALYGLVAKADQLKENVTIVRVLSDDENGGATTEVLLIDDAAISSPAGWQLYTTGSAPSTGTGSGSLLSYKFTFPVEVAGAQSFPLPAGTQDVFFVQARTTYGVLRTLDVDHYRFSGGNLVIDAAAKLEQNEEVQGKRYTGGGSGGSSRDNNAVPQATKDAARDSRNEWNASDLTSYFNTDLQAAAIADVQKGDFFDDYELGSIDALYRYTYCQQTGGAVVGWTRIPKPL